MSLCLSVVLYVGTLKLIHDIVWSHVAILSSLIYDSLLYLFVYFNLMLMHVSSVVSDLCDPMDCSSPGSSVYGILQERILEWVAISPSGDFLDPGMEPASPALAGGFLTTEPLESSNFNLIACGELFVIGDISIMVAEDTPFVSLLQPTTCR